MFRSLQASRAVAAGLVVLFHLGGTFAQQKYFGARGFDVAFAWSDAGVDFFFVLSGFLIASVHRGDIDRPRALLPYLAKRALRIYPTYWLVCAVVCLGAFVVPSFRESLPGDAWTWFKTLALLPQDPAVVGGTGAPILFVAWSMQYEVLFYGVFALFIASRTAGLIAVAGLVAAQVGCRTGSSGCGFPLSFVGSHLMLLFAMGVASAAIVRSRVALPPRAALALAGVAIAAFVAFGALEAATVRDPFGLDRRLVYGALSAAIVVGLARAEASGALVVRQRWVAQLGDASYALYLLHIPIISVLCKLGVALGVGAGGPAVLIAFFAFVFAVCVGVSYVFYGSVERPLLRFFRARLGSSILQPDAAPQAAPMQRHGAH